MRTSVLTVGILAASPLVAQGSPSLLRDVRSLGTAPTRRIEAGFSRGSVALFRAGEASTGFELWRSDGTVAGTVPFPEAMPGPGPDYPSPLDAVSLNGITFFAHHDSGHGVELWRSDGTDNGTWLFKDTQPGVDGVVRSLTSVGARFFFVEGDSLSSRLWTSDGTASGTLPLRSFQPFPLPMLGTAGGRLFFTARDSSTGTELWTSDGSVAGTRLLRDIFPGTTGAFDRAAPFMATIGNDLLFDAEDGANGRELWRSDGTAAGTVLVKDIYPGVGSAFRGCQYCLGSDPVASLGPQVCFAATDPTGGVEPWITDGTAANTRRLLDVRQGSFGSDPAEFTTLGSYVLFWADSGQGRRELWRTDGSSTVLFAAIEPPTSLPAPHAPFAVGGRMLFAADDGSSGAELWSTDALAVQRIGDLVPGPAGSSPRPVAALRVGTTDGVILATAATQPQELWWSDGTALTTRRILRMPSDLPGSSPTQITGSTGVAYFTADDGVTGRELWRSDGSSAGTFLLKDINPFNDYDEPRVLGVLGGTVFFSARDPSIGRELWRSDGTVPGTVLVADINPSPWGSGLDANQSAAVVLNGQIVFAADDGGSGFEPWISDGTAPGTHRLVDLRTGAAGSNPEEFVYVAGTVFFRADDGVHGMELWKTDGTAAGTSMVLDIQPGPNGSWGDAGGVAALGTRLIFAADDGVHGEEPWASDGTAAGTYLLRDVIPGALGSLWNPGLWDFAVARDALCFVAEDATGFEPWRTDGTSQGTWQLRDVFPGPGSSSPYSFTAAGDQIYFAAADPTSGMELWRSDGTTVGTARFLDLRPGPASSMPRFAEWGGFVQAMAGSRRVLFSASSGQPGVQVWVTDGTLANTRQHAGIALGPRDYRDRVALAVAQGRLVLAGDDGVVGLEPWAMRSVAACVPFGHGCRGSSGVPDASGDAPILGQSFTARLGRARALSPAALFLDAAPAAVRIDPTCLLLVASASLALPVSIDAQGKGSYPIAVPSTPSLNGRQLFAQFAVADPGGTFLGALALSQGLQLILGTE